MWFYSYNVPKTYHYNYYESSKYGVNCSVFCFIFSAKPKFVPYSPETYRLLALDYYEDHGNFEFWTLQSNIFKVYKNVLIFTTSIFLIGPVLKNAAHSEYRITLLLAKLDHETYYVIP